MGVFRQALRSGDEPSIEAILINDNYKIKVEGNETVKYGIVNFDEKDQPSVLVAAEVPLKSGIYLDTQSTFGADNNIPFVIRDSATGEEISRITPQITDITLPDEDDDPERTPPSENTGGGGGCSAGFGTFGWVILALGTALAMKGAKNGRSGTGRR
jgi:hypothetical protein